MAADSDIVAGLLGDRGGAAAVLGADYEPRPQQLRMAAAVRGAMASGSHLVVEAGTGTGKSFAYLAPAIERCLLHGEVVVIATHTIALQEQLVAKDIPLLMDALGPERAAELRPVLVKGRGNYLSIRRLALTARRQDRLLSDAAARRSLHVIEDWAYSTQDGTLATLPPIERPGVWDRVQSDSGNCMGRRCPTYDRCFYQSARREMERGNLLICNHALFFSDLALRARFGGAGFLPAYAHAVLDEAHGIEDVAADHFGLSLTEARVHHLLGLLYQPRANKGYLAQLRADHAAADAAERAVSAVLGADAAARELFDGLLELHRCGLDPSGRVRQPGAVDNPLTGAMNDLTLALRRLREQTEDEADRFELQAYAQRSAEIASAAESLINQDLPGCCYWVETNDHAGEPGGSGRRRVALACSPVEVAPLLKEHLFAQPFSVTMTSATLATRTIGQDEPAEHAEAAFAHFTRRVGCEGAPTLQLGSPFDHARQMTVHIDRTMPQPAHGDPGSERAHERALLERILEHTEDVGGGVFALFTSFRTLERLAAMAQEPLDALGYPLLAQRRGPGAGSRGAMLERFRESGRAVLFGAASFWQGVDVRGEALRCVIITRLPFEPPDRPLTEARLDLIRARGGDPFREDSLPRAVIRFKQGIGRLIRSRTDTGRVVVLDPRIVTKPYGSAFLRAMPEGVRPADD